MGRVLVTRRLPDGGLDPLASTGHEIVGPKTDDTAYTPEQLRAFAGECDAIVSLLTDKIDADVLAAGAAGGRLKVVANVAVGYDNIDVRTATAHGIVVCNTPGVLDQTTADTAWLLILGASRLASTAEADLRTGRWKGWGITQYLGRDVHGATLGVVGYGRIGQAVAERARGFGMLVVHHARRPTDAPHYMDDLDELLAYADIVSLHIPGGPDTHHLIDARRLALMKPTAVLVNTARGTVVDELALAEALHADQLFAAGIDVYEREPAIEPRLLSAPRTVLLPHIGSASQATRLHMATMATNAVANILAGRTPPNIVTPT
ncbi:MAG: glyoxylate reductase [Actinomycetota bacterium]|jgi:glyoxylate reductase|nr:glyoxylate reductase [Actinomycetota bacterium]